MRDNASRMGSRLVRVNIGTSIAGPSIRTSRFAGLSPISVDLSNSPPDPATGQPVNYDGHQYSIVGSFKTLAPDSTVHMMTPYPGFIAPEVQQAYFNASVFFDDPGALPKFPTTVEMALFVFDHQGGAGATMQGILDGMFKAPPPAHPVVLAGNAPSEAEGTLFPHDPDADGLFTYHSLFNSVAGTLSVDICLPISIDVSQSSVNVGKKGVLPVVVLTTSTFDAVTELDPSTVSAVLFDDHHVVIGSVPALRWSAEDVDHDGHLDMTFKFSVPDLVTGPQAPLTEISASIDFRGRTFAGMCVEGSDTVRIVPSKK